MSYKILFSNIGYARGIDGSLRSHVNFFGRHFYCALPVQEQVLAQVKSIITRESPDLCCFVEIDQGSAYSGGFNQMSALLDAEYSFHDIAGKYGEESLWARAFFHKGKSNAFLAKAETQFERLYFKYGTKRLVYRLGVMNGISVLFAHFSLNRKIRQKQFVEVRQLINTIGGEVILLADFNIMYGFKELEPLLHDEHLCVLNNEEGHTFTFHTRKLTLDLCICSQSLVERMNLQIIPQPFSDHAALLVEVSEAA